MHPNVVRLWHTFEDAEFFYLVLELCERGELLAAVKKTAAIVDEQQIAAYFAQIVAGVAFLHARGIIHRDLKLSNVLLTAEGTIVSQKGLFKPFYLRRT